MNASTDLTNLLAQIKSGTVSLSDNLPTFGTEPADTSELWTWDATHQIAGSCAHDARIELRDDVCHCDEHTQAELRTCDSCGWQAWITDCGCLPQPRPIAPLDHHVYCDACASVEIDPECSHFPECFCGE